MSDRTEVFAFAMGTLCIIAAVSFVVGATCAVTAKEKKCSYQSIATRINIPFILGCELFEKRWE